MARIIDPRRRCFALADWPDVDRRLWEAAIAARQGRFSKRGLAPRLAPASLEKTMEGYGRWLGFQHYHGRLDPEVGPLARLDEDQAAAYLDRLR